MRLKQLLGMVLAGTVLIGGVVGVNAAELDLAWYAKQNPDVVAAFGNSPEMLQMHYEMFGRKEARMANTNDVEAQLRRLFNPTEYATINPDVKAAFGENAEAMFQHYMAFGLLEGRRPSEKVSKDVAASMKKAVEKTMKDAGLVATPGSPQLVAVITGAVKTDIGQTAGAAVQQALAQAVTTATTPQTEEKKDSKPAKSGYSERKNQSDGTYIIMEYDADGRNIKNTTYNADDTLKSWGDVTYNGSIKTDTQYYANGKIMQKSSWDTVAKMKFYENIQYDENGKKTKEEIYKYELTGGVGTRTVTTKVYGADSSYTKTVEKMNWKDNVGPGNKIWREEYTNETLTKKYEYTYDSNGTLTNTATTEYDENGSPQVSPSSGNGQINNS